MTVNKGKNRSEVEIVTALICDGVRKEISGQDIVIGVYSDAINIAQLPANLALTLYLRLRFKKIDSTEIEFRAMGESGVQILPDVRFGIAPPETGHIITVAMGPLPITVQTFGKITFELKFPETDWEAATDVTFVKMTNVPSVKINQPTGRPNV